MNPSLPSRPSIPWWRTSIGQDEINALNDAVRAERFSMGSGTAAMEDEICRQLDVPYAIACTSGSTGLMMTMMALGVGPGDEVIIPTRTFVATAHAASWLGAKVVLVDCLASNSLIDTAQVAARITPRTRAIVPVHLNGRAADMAPLLALGRDKGIAVVEDAAQAFRSRCALGLLGTLGEMGVFSFGMTKLVSCGQGGAVVTRDPALGRRLRQLRSHGLAPSVDHKYEAPGMNFRLTDMQAAIGLHQLKRIDEKIAHCVEVYRLYREALGNCPGISIVPTDIDHGEVPSWTEFLCVRRDALHDFLAGRGVETRRFTPSVHTAPYFGVPASDFPNGSRFDANGIVLPSGPAQPLDHVRATAAAVREFYEGAH